jgi:hypothetical protein
MIEGEKSQRIRSMSADEETQAWMAENLPELKQKCVRGQRLLYQFLVFGFVVGLAAHVGGYVLLSSAPSGLLGLMVDLRHALGWSLWTGVVVALFVQVIPEVKRRQIRQAVDTKETLRRDGTSGLGSRTDDGVCRPDIQQIRSESIHDVRT